jgi:hypothetical protein
MKISGERDLVSRLIDALTSVPCNPGGRGVAAALTP